MNKGKGAANEDRGVKEYRYSQEISQMVRFTKVVVLDTGVQALIWIPRTDVCLRRGSGTEPRRSQLG
jgi:hypothetical protein